MRALVIEGGGMRGAYANGVLAAFEEFGIRSTDFDALYGTSAGGALSAWYTAAQARYALQTWEYARDPRVISYKRWLLRRGPLLDHDGLFRMVYETERPLNVPAVQRAPHPVVVTVTDADTGEPHAVDIRRGPVLAWLRATGRLPLLMGPPVELDGRRWLDGGVANPIPLEEALRDGATEIVLVMNNPPGWRAREPANAIRAVARRYPALAPVLQRRHEEKNRAIRVAADPPPGVRIHTIQPSSSTGVGRMSRDMRRVRAAIDRGRSDGLAFSNRLTKADARPAA